MSEFCVVDQVIFIPGRKTGFFDSRVKTCILADDQITSRGAFQGLDLNRKLLGMHSIIRVKELDVFAT
jgi:hypothetical protein